MLAFMKPGADFSRGCAHPATRPPISATHPVTRKNRSPGNRTPARRGSRPELPWTAHYLGVEVNHHTRSARAPLTCHPRTTLNIVHAPFKASHAGALLVINRFCSHHDHAISSSMSWSSRSSKLWMSSSLPLLRDDSRYHIRPSALLITLTSSAYRP